MLAGGHSRRFGETNKAIAVVNETTFVERVVQAVSSVTDNPPIIAVDTTDQRATVETGLDSVDDLVFTSDTPSFQGPLSGLYGSLSAIDDQWLFLTGCDMPRLSAEAIGWLASRLPTTCASPDALVPVHSDGEPEPLHAFYRQDAVADVRSELRSDASLRALHDALPELETVPISAAPSDVSLDASVKNVNTKREYHRIRRKIEK
ncbi:molybdenum cofactor guanylyltransferase [Halomicrococcus sp. NG-SE-24]|uniref:molybdenum cofactor guanylyltransferase n=1 Tax=Halomicrococcus sp. NG-SE-24 TaxID=3436928 RepID=UPI003D99A46E